MGRPRALTADQVAEVRRLAGEGLSLRAIAGQVGASKDTVRRVLAPAARPRPVEPVAAAEPAPPPTPASATHRRIEAAETRSAPRRGLQPMTDADHAAMDRDRMRRPSWLGWW